MNRIAIENEAGNPVPCSILDIFEFEGHQYAMLLREKDEVLVIMRMRIINDQTKFIAIESDEEFESVLQYVKERAESNRDGE